MLCDYRFVISPAPMSTQLKWRARRRRRSHRTNLSALKNLLLLGEGRIKLRIPMKPAGDSDLKPAVVPT